MDVKNILAYIKNIYITYMKKCYKEKQPNQEVIWFIMFTYAY